MGATTGTIQGSFGWDNSPLIAGLTEAEQITTRSSARMQRQLNHASNSFTNIFRRSPNMRAERALSGFFERAATGDIAGAITQISGRMTGLGIIAGVAIGAGVEIFQKFREQIVATREAHEALQNEMIKRPLSNVTSLSGEGMEQALQTREKLAEDLRKKAEHTFGSELGEAFKSTLAGPTFGAIGGKDNGRERLEVQMDLNKETKESKGIMESQAALAMTLLGIQRQELTGDERSAKIAMIILDAEQKRAALKGKGLSAKAFAVQDEALTGKTELAIGQVENQTASQGRKFLTAVKEAELERSGLPDTQKKALSAAGALRDINQSLAAPGTSEAARRGLILDKMKQEAALNIIPSNVAPLSADWWRRKNAGESMDMDQALTKTGLSQAQINQYKTGSSDLSGSDSTAVVEEIQKLIAVIEKAWN